MYKRNIDKHYLTQKHIENNLLIEHPIPINYKDFLVENKNNNTIIICNICNKEYKHQSSYSRHKNKCIENNKQRVSSCVFNNDIQIMKKDIECLKNTYNYLVELNKLNNGSYTNTNSNV
jgi:uncharacterized C2H2 Zn-finger protein